MKKPAPITSYEHHILLLVEKGLSNTSISNHIGKSVNTVKYHLKNIYKKLGATNRVEAIHKYNLFNQQK